MVTQILYAEAPDTVSLPLSNGSRGEQFVMPATTPKKSEWIPDNAVTLCMVCCAENFSMVRDRETPFVHLL